MYLKYGLEIAEDVKSFHLQNGGISRFEKFIHWEKEIFNRDINQQQLEKINS